MHAIVLFDRGWYRMIVNDSMHVCEIKSAAWRGAAWRGATSAAEQFAHCKNTEIDQFDYSNWSIYRAIVNDRIKVYSLPFNQVG